MDLPVDKFIEGLFTEEAENQPSDTVKEEELVLELPPWFDEKQYNHARRFYWDNSFAFASSMLMGLVAVFAVPSILKVLVSSHRSSSMYTAYKRYLSTILHTVTWFEYELKPGTLSWKSLYAVRSRHLRAGKAVKLQGNGTVSQRDIALTQFGFIGFSILKPDKFGIATIKEDDWEAFNHFWRTIGYMIGLEDRYNICRKTIHETREVCQILLDRVYTPCLDNAPEYFEHMARVMLNGMWSVNPTIQDTAFIYFCKYLANVPGYILTEEERIAFEKNLRAQLKNKPENTGVESRSLTEKPVVKGLPSIPPRLIYLKDYKVLETIPPYKALTVYEKYKVNFFYLTGITYSTFLGRWYFNLNYWWSLILMKYCPYLAFIRFGITASFVNIFVESPTDDSVPKPNSYYYKTNNSPWYKSWLSFFRRNDA